MPQRELTKHAQCALTVGNYAISFPPLFLPLCHGSSFPDELRNDEDRFYFRKLSGQGLQAQ
jgi:hypothetical protein